MTSTRIHKVPIHNAPFVPEAHAGSEHVCDICESKKDKQKDALNGMSGDTSQKESSQENL